MEDNKRGPSEHEKLGAVSDWVVEKVLFEWVTLNEWPKDTREVDLVGEERGRGLGGECARRVQRPERELVRHPVGVLGATELLSLLFSLHLLI